MPNDSVVHPQAIVMNGCTYRVVAYCTLTDTQAANAVLLYLRTHKGKKPKRGTVVTVMTTYTEATRHLLG